MKGYLHVLLQDSTSSGANVKRLESESAAAVKGIEKSIASKKKEVSCMLSQCVFCGIRWVSTQPVGLLGLISTRLLCIYLGKAPLWFTDTEA